MKTYDAIVVGAGHNGLTNAAFLAKAGLDVVCVEKNDYIGGASVSHNLHEDWIYSNCSYVCSLLRQSIHRDLDLTRHGLMIVPYNGTTNFSRNGDYVAEYPDPDMQYREIRRHSLRDADAMHRYEAYLMRYAKLIRHFLLRTPADPTSFKPRDLRELVFRVALVSLVKRVLICEVRVVLDRVLACFHLIQDDRGGEDS